MAEGYLFSRAAGVIVGKTGLEEGIAIEGLRVSFRIQKTLERTPNTCDLRIWNLSERTRGLIQGKGLPVLVVAGYEGETGQIFAGDSRTVDHVKEGADWVTRIQCGDGEAAYAAARVSESFGKGTPVVDVILSLVKKLGVKAGNSEKRVRSETRLQFEQLAHGYALQGKVSNELDTLLRAKQLTWSIQDGALQLLGPRELLPGEGVLLDSDHGLIGTPSHGSPPADGKPSLLKARSLLQPVFRPGGRVRLRSSGLRGGGGDYRIERLGIVGDTAGGDWYSDLELSPA